MIIASERMAADMGLTIRARVAGVASAGVAPRVMGIGPVPATRKLLARLHIDIGQIDIVELNEAFAAQGPIRAMMSVGGPAANGTTRRTTRLGQFGDCAGAASGHATAPPTPAMSSRGLTRIPRWRGRAMTLAR